MSGDAEYYKEFSDAQRRIFSDLYASIAELEKQNRLILGYMEGRAFRYQQKDYHPPVTGHALEVSRELK